MNIERNDHDMDPELGKYVNLSDAMLGTIRKCAQVKLSIATTMDFLVYDHPGNNFNKAEVESHFKAFREASDPKEVSQTAQLLTLLNQKAYTLDTLDGWYYDATYDSANGLTRLFWMNPNQRELYRRYHDVVVNDTTLQTNRLGMALNCFVVVDAHFKTRLVACALIRQECTSDYEWILRQLKKASGGLQPKVLMVDEDPTMDAACSEVFRETRIVNCIWHINNSIRTHIRPLLDNENFISFKKRFAQVREALTKEGFDRLWDQLLRDYGGRRDRSADPTDSDEDEGTMEVRAYLERLYERRSSWAGPWIKPSFTAGMQSIQRVKMIHNLIKSAKVNSQTTLVDLFNAISKTVGDEYFQIKSSRMRKAPDPADSMIVKTFNQVLRVNRRYLTEYAMNALKTEMGFSFGFCHQSLDIQELLQHKERGGSSKPTKKQTQGDIQKQYASALILDSGPTNVLAVFSVEDKTSLESEVVVLFKDRTHFCTCVLLINKGIVCRHYFWMMQEDSRFVYHVKLVLRRWFEEDKQESKVVHDMLKEEPFVVASTRRVQDSVENEGDNLHDTPSDLSTPIHQIFYPSQPIVGSSRQQRVSKKRFATAMGMSKKISEELAKSSVTDEQFISIMEAMGNIKQSIGELTKERTDAEHAGNGDSRITEGAGDIVNNSSASAAKIQENLSRATIDTQDASAGDGDVDVAPDLFKEIPVVDIIDDKAPQGKGRPKGKRLRASYEVKQDRQTKVRRFAQR